MFVATDLSIDGHFFFLEIDIFGELGLALAL